MPATIGAARCASLRPSSMRVMLGSADEPGPEHRGAIPGRRRTRPATTRASTSRPPTQPGGARLAPAHDPQAAGRGADGRAVADRLRRRRRRAQGDEGELRAPPRSPSPTGAYIQIGGPRSEPGSARKGDRRRERANAASWDLDFDDGAEPLRHLPREFLYTLALPKTKLLSPYPCAPFSGSGRDRRASGSSSTAGPGWSATTGEPSTPSAGSGSRRGPSARTRRLPRHRGRPDQDRPDRPRRGSPTAASSWAARSTGSAASSAPTGPRSTRSPTGCEFTLPGKSVNVKGRVSAPREGLRRLGLRRPRGARAQRAQLLDRRHRAAGSSGPARSTRELELPGAAVYELGTRDTDHGMPLQPYPDG